jgi:hypothetical protein
LGPDSGALLEQVPSLTNKIFGGFAVSFFSLLHPDNLPDPTPFIESRYYIFLLTFLPVFVVYIVVASWKRVEPDITGIASNTALFITGIYVSVICFFVVAKGMNSNLPIFPNELFIAAFVMGAMNAYHGGRKTCAQFKGLFIENE